ncbi:hypothetical protein S40285_01554 [Stachybotrys chlorohalonatus IBT 40285]|uniref:Uncharacterized protein n=1 Tax=Stachybotrys chlorohalonatus (strain IBT 40285) TaxID=1283841 RepID=A0A084QW54_STAC4|nr:hypothetical protein S40285_01554 [Stachybotrys chlorohalonata IBT 40285]
MRLPFRRKDKKKQELSTSSIPDEFRTPGAGLPPLFPPTRGSAYLLAHFPTPILERIFALVCPHSRDESYETCEGSATDTACMLCDLRDLSHCAQVSRAWRIAANRVLYHSVRIDPVHYCPLEAWLADRRKQRSRFDKNGVPEDPAQTRLKLFRRTVRDDPTRIGKLVHFLKVPYMLRESCHIELAQTLAVLPNLLYVDLPEGMFSDEPAYSTLRLEVQSRCPNLRKMTYVTGSERSFATLASGQVWPHLEVLELNGLNLDAMTMRTVLGRLAKLRALKVTESPGLTDEVLGYAEDIPSLHPLEELVLKDTPGVTAAGIIEYLAWKETQKALKVLTLNDTGVAVTSLPEILTMASSLSTMALQAKVLEPFPHSSNTRLLTSMSLETLRYEISPASSTGSYSSVAAGYYKYLATSILQDGLPRLRRLYVHDDSFPEQLQGLPPPNAAFAEGHVRSNGGAFAEKDSFLSPSRQARKPASPISRPVSRVPPTNRFSSNNPFAPRVGSPPGPKHLLEVYTKSDEFSKWNFARVDPFKASSSPSRRPVSSYGLAADVSGQGWDPSAARRSVMIGNGAGGFLTVPGAADPVPALPFGAQNISETWRPHSSGGDVRRSKDLWR